MSNQILTIELKIQKQPRKIYKIMQSNTVIIKEKGLLHLILGALGICISYVLIGICSQNLYNSLYESSSEFNQDGNPLTHKFKYPSLIVWLSGLSCAMLGQVKSWISGEGKNPIPTKETLILGSLFAINMTASNFALLYVSYPTHALCSNARYLAIVLIGTYLSRVPQHHDLKLPKQKLYVAIFITLGVILFNLLKFTSVVHDDHHSFQGQWKGYFLIFTSMIAESLFCDHQAYNKSQFKPIANHFFKSANFYSFIFSVIMSLIMGNFFQGINFVLQHSQCLKQIILLCTLQVIGQLSIYFIVTNFKQHIFPLISATRKIITVICSILIFNHTLSALQFVCVVMVFAGMIYEVSEEIKEKRQKTKAFAHQWKILDKQE